MQTTWQRLLERLASGHPVLTAEDVRGWPSREFDQAVRLGILRETDAATSVLCDACAERHWSDVVWVSGGRRAIIACPQEGTVDVEPTRLRQWRIDAGRVAELTANALGLTSPVDVLLPEYLWSLGRRRLGGRYRDIFLGVGGGPALAEMSTAIRSAAGHTSALLLTVGCDGDGLQAGHQAVVLASVSQMGDEGLAVDLDYLEDRFAEGAGSSRKAPRSIPAPASATWGDVSVVVCDSSLRVTVCGNSHEVEFDEIGVDQQAQPIELLRLFAAARGTLDAAKLRSLVSGDSPVKARTSRLRQLLQALVDVDGDPLGYGKKAQLYTCRFQVRLDRDNGFRTPAGASWLDFAFHERTDGRLLVSATEKQSFRGHRPEGQGDRTTAEVAEERETITRIHSLEEIGLRADKGKLTEEGAAFMELLRAGGILARRSNDIVVLKLAQRLREWTGLEGEPLRLVEASRSWTAAFACSSDIKPKTK